MKIVFFLKLFLKVRKKNLLYIKFQKYGVFYVTWTGHFNWIKMHPILFLHLKH